MAQNLRKQALKLPVTVQIGKKGISDGTILEIQKQLKTKKMVKIKLLRSFHDDVDKTDVAALLAKYTESELLLRRGFIIILYKPIGKN